LACYVAFIALQMRPNASLLLACAGESAALQSGSGGRAGKLARSGDDRAAAASPTKAARDADASASDSQAAAAEVSAEAEAANVGSGAEAGAPVAAPAKSAKEVKKRLRELKQPVTLFGETAEERAARLVVAQAAAHDDDFSLGGGHATR
jgi:pre-mRNA processing factor 4 (PRP4) like